MFDDRVLTEAHALMANRALRSVRAIDAVTDPVARLWCRSFGVTDDEAVSRLKDVLSDAAIDEIAGGASLDDLQERLDGVAESAIRTWFASILDEPVAPTTQALAIVRLAFLDANVDGRWGPCFLSDVVPSRELAADLESVMILPTPVARPRHMPRQEI